MMKRILSSFIVFVLVLSLCSVSYADVGLTENIENKYKTLNSLGILPDEKYENYGMFRNLSKTGFINFVLNVYDEYGYTEEKNDEALRMAEGLKLIQANQTDLYKPICYEEALTILVRFLGYENHAQSGGGFPYGYIKIAHGLGLTDNLVAGLGDTLREHDVINILYNLINCASVDMIAINKDGIIYGNASDRTVLHVLRGIYRVDGILEGANGTVIKDGLSVSDGNIMINNYIYKAENDYSKYIGLDVTAYVQESRGNDDTVICLLPDVNKELIIQAEDIKDVNNNFRTVEYYSLNKVKKVSVSPIAAVLYNGQPLKNYTKELFMPEDGEIRFIESNNNSEYDTVFITSYKTIVIDYVSKINKNVRNKYQYDTINQIINFDENGEDVIRIIDGENEIEFSDLEIGDILRVAESSYNGKRIITVYVSKRKISGTVTSIKNDDYTVITIDGGEYALSRTFEAAVKAGEIKAINIGASYEFSLDSEGRIAYAEDATGLMKYGIVMAVATDGALSQECRIKLFTTEGEWKELVFDDKIKYNDGVSGERNGVLPENILGDIKTAKNGDISVIKYMTNSKGKIKSLELPVQYNDSTVENFNYVNNVQYNYRVNNRSFDSEVFIADDAVMWSVNPNKLTEEKAYGLTTRSALTSDGIYVLSAYNIDEYKFSDLFVIISTDTVRDNAMLSNDLFMIKDTGEMLGSDGSIVGMITGMTGVYDTLTYPCEDLAFISELRIGDTIVAYSDSGGNIDYYIKYRSASDGEVYQDPGSMHSSSSILQGKVVKNDCSGYRMKIDSGSGERIIRTAENTVVMIYDMESGEVYRGNIADIEEGAFITTKLVRSQLKSIAVYQ